MSQRSCWLELSDILVHSGQIHTVRDIISTPPEAGTEMTHCSSESAVPGNSLKRWYFSASHPISTSLICFTRLEGEKKADACTYGYINHPMHLFFLTHCLVELQQFGSVAISVAKVLYGTVRAMVDGAPRNLGALFSRSPALLCLEALALYSIRDYDASQVRS